MDDKVVEGFMGMVGVRYWAISGMTTIATAQSPLESVRVKYCLTERAANI
jgi:hypothetical protein